MSFILFKMLSTFLILSLLFPELHLIAPQTIAPQFRIENGKPAKIGQFPYYVGLLDRQTHKHYCGGAIIGQRRILTTASCVEEYDCTVKPANTIDVMAGTIFRHDTIGIDHVVRITVHPDRVCWQRVYNFAVLETANDLFDEYSKNREPIRVAKRLIEYGTRCVLCGWGATQTGQVPEELLYINLFVTENMLCGGARAMGVDFVCGQGLEGRNAGLGDMGAALVCNHQLIGLMSWKAAQAPFAKYASVWSIREWAIDDDPTAARKRHPCESNGNRLDSQFWMIVEVFATVLICWTLWM